MVTIGRDQRDMWTCLDSCVHTRCRSDNRPISGPAERCEENASVELWQSMRNLSGRFCRRIDMGGGAAERHYHASADCHAHRVSVAERCPELDDSR